MKSTRLATYFQQNKLENQITKNEIKVTRRGNRGKSQQFKQMLHLATVSSQHAQIQCLKKKVWTCLKLDHLLNSMFHSRFPNRSGKNKTQQNAIKTAYTELHNYPLNLFFFSVTKNLAYFWCVNFFLMLVTKYILQNKTFSKEDANKCKNFVLFWTGSNWKIKFLRKLLFLLV